MPPHHWFQIALQSLRRSPSERHLPGQALDRVIKDLESLNADTERDFLAIGESLIGFRSTSRQLYSDISSLTELLAGDQAGNASRSLSGILKLSAELNAQMERSTIALAQIHEFSSHIRIAFAGLGNTVSLFRTLCTLTRIETSRLGNTGAGFGDLAAEARPLSESIQVCRGHSGGLQPARPDHPIRPSHRLRAPRYPAEGLARNRRRRFGVPDGLRRTASVCT